MNDILSLSASSKAAKDVVASALAGVQLSKEEEKSYNDVFFPGRSVTKTRKTSLKHYDQLVQAMTEISYGLNAMFCSSRLMLTKGSQIDATPIEQMQPLIENKLREIANPNATAIKEANKFYHALLTSGKGFHISESKRYPGGYDIVFAGNGHPSSTLKVTPTEEFSLIRDSGKTEADKQFVEDRRLASYLTERSRAITAAGQEVTNRLFPDGAGSSKAQAMSRVLQVLPLDFDFVSLVRTMANSFGEIVLPELISQNVPDNVVESLGEYVSLMVIRRPAQFLIEETRKSVMYQEETTPINTEERLTDEGFFLDQDISFGLVFSLPENIARYITQTEEGTEVSMATLTNWARIWSAAVLRKSGSRAGAGAMMGGKKIPIKKLPRYILPNSKAKQVRALREKHNYHVEDGKTNEDNLYVSGDGSLHYAPRATDEEPSNVENYEKDLDDLLKRHYALNLPLDMHKQGLPDPSIYIDTRNYAEVESLRSSKKVLQKYAGSFVAQTWDYDTQLHIDSSDPSVIKATSLAGSVAVEDTAIADYLGFQAEQDPWRGKSFADAVVAMMPKARGVDKSSLISANDVGNSFAPDRFLATPTFQRLFQFYALLAHSGKVLGYQQLVNNAAKALDITSLEEHFEKGSYNSRLSDSLIVTPELTVGEVANSLLLLLSKALSNATCEAGTPVFMKIMEDNGLTSIEDGKSAAAVSKYYFVPNTSPMKDFGNVYNLLGGRIFKEMMDQLASLPPKDLLASPDLEDPKVDVDAIPCTVITSQIMPFAIMLSKYVPRADEFYAKAQESADAYSQETDITADEIRIPGIKAGSQMFPHQVKAQGPLRRRPRVSFLDIDPGGGKTITGIADAAACVKEMQELGTKVKPLMIAPDNLVRNWCDDLTKFLGANWNVVPLTTQTYRRWGEERLEEVLADAPPNTVVVTGINFLKAQSFPIVIGANVVMISGTLEFVKRFGYNYILMDESHKAKNPRSRVHQTIKQLTTASNVKFVRLATGTLISNVMTDIVGQAALTTPHVFGSKEKFIEENTDPDTGGWLPETPSRSRQLLNIQASVVTKKRKEWAFMMPNPIENFYAVSLEDADNPNPEDALVSEIYNAVLQETLESLEKAIKSKKAISSEDGDDTEDSSDMEDPSSSQDLDIDDNEELAGLEALLQPYLQRLERILTDPMGDPLGAEIFRKQGIESYTTRKVSKVIELVENHFTLEVWDKGRTEYKELSTVTHEGQNYLHRKVDTTTTERKMIPNNGKTPDQDLDTWKPEPQGKVLIFCQYTRSVAAVYDALPPHLKKVARKFSGGLTGENSDKWQNLDDFKKSDAVQILVANERAIAEGHNMQIASRMIRVEQPWAPGDLEQSSARIFRPDPAAAKSMATTGRPGDLYREAIHLDWVLANGTMEVAKFGRLIYKIVSKTQFDESGNERYDGIMGADLEPIGMGLDTISSRFNLSDFGEYTTLYSEIKNIQINEFTEMRRTGDSSMQDLPETPNVEGARRIENLPLLDDQLIADPDGFGLVSGRDFITDPKNQEFTKDPNGLIGQPVKTEFGTGVVVGVKANYTQTDFGKIVNVHKPVRSLQIRLNGSDDLVSYPITQIYFATQLTDENASKFSTNKPWATDAQKAKILKRIEAANAERDKQAEEDAAAEKKRKIKELRAAEAAQTSRKRTAKRKENKAKGRPLNEGIKEVKELTAPSLPSGKKRRKVTPAVQVSDMEENMRIDLTPNVYNGILGVMVDMADPDAKLLKSMGFHLFGEYAYLTIKTGRHFDAALDYLEDNFKLSNQTVSRLDQFADLFDKAENWRFNAELADVTEAKQFFRTRHIVTKGRNEIKVYPNALPEELILSVDIRTNPSIRKHLGKKVAGIPGRGGSWQTSPGSAISFVRTKSEAKRIIATLKREGYVINNEQEFLAELQELRVRRTRG